MFRIRLYFVALLIVLFGSVNVSAKMNLDSYHKELPDLTIDENLQSPEIPKKLLARAKEAMQNLQNSFKAQNFDTDLTERDGLVLMITIPVSEIFAANDTVVMEQATAKLSQLATPLRIADKYKLLITVHSDDTGSSDYLYSLTQARADALVQWIADNGIPVDGVVPYGVGFDEPISTEANRVGRAANRRVEFYFVPGPILIESLKVSKR